MESSIERNGFRIKSIIATLAIVVLCSMLMAAFGDPSDWYMLHVQIEEKYGVTKLDIGSSAGAGLVVIVRNGTSAVAFPGETPLNAADLAPLEQPFQDQTQLDQRNYPDWLKQVLAARGITGTARTGTVSSGAVQSMLELEPLSVSQVSARMVFKNDLVSLYILRKRSADSGYDIFGFQSSLPVEFFPGEGQLFAALPEDQTYIEKALGLLYYMIHPASGTDVQFEQTLESMGVSGDAATIRAAKEAIAHLHFSTVEPAKQALMQQMMDQFIPLREPYTIRAPAPMETFDLPYFDFTPATFSTIYEAGTRNIYASGYLAFLLQVGKPLYSRAFYDLLIKKKGLPYRYEDYMPIDEAQGEELAAAALRYASWGVEYTDFVGAGSLSYGSQSRAVAQELSDATWPAVASSAEGARLQNYAPTVSTVADVNIDPMANPATWNGEQRFNPGAGQTMLLSATSADGSRMPVLEHLEIWTARNLCWDFGVVAAGFSAQLTGQDATKVKTTNLGESLKSALKDRALSGASELVTVSRGSEDSCGLGVEFAGGGKSIGALMVTVIPSGTRTSGFNPQDPQTRILYKSDGVWKQLPFSQNKPKNSDVYCQLEVVLHGVSVDFFQKTLGTALYAGKAVGSGAFQLYYVFSAGFQRQNIQAICIFDGSGRETLTASELAVFDGDPLGALYSAAKLPSFSMVTTPTVSVRPYTATLIGKNPSLALDAWTLLMPSFVAQGQPLEVAGGRLFVEVHFPVVPLAPIRQIAVWWDGQGGLSLDSYIGDRTMLSSPFFLPYDERQMRASVPLTTPFEGCGNPLPYAPWGIDSPRTFNWKMLEQRKVRVDRLGAAAEGSTRAVAKIEGSTYVEEDYQQYYWDEPKLWKLKGRAGALSTRRGDYAYTVDDATYGDWLDHLPEFSAGKTMKPFLPGYYAVSTPGRVPPAKSLASPDKSAGVDALGMLAGSIAMTSFYDSVLNAANIRTGVELDKYYTMSDATIKGVNGQGKPVYYAKPGQGLLDGLYRLARSDIERMTVLIPDLSMVRQGDLLVRYDVEGDPHVGIVVSCGWGETRPAYGVEPGELMQQITVVSVRRGFREVAIGMWGNGEGSFGGFTDSPESYQVRRLLVKKEPSAPPAAGSHLADAWDLVDSSIAVLNLRLMKSFSEPISERFIPNTGEGLDFQVSVQAENLFGLNLNENLGPTVEFLFLSPEDPFYDEEPLDTPEASNVYRNRGGGFEIYVQDVHGTYTVVTFELEPPGGDGLSRYRVSGMSGKLTVEQDVYETGGEQNAGRLWYTRAGRNYYRFFIRPLAGNIRPGDDLVLRLCLKDTPTVVGAASADRIATYDKKLLWRANLYIDDGATDWNNKNPWVGTAIDSNEWNTPPQGYTGVLGGQVIKIADWTRYYDPLIFTNAETSVTSHIAYTSGSADSPLEANNKLQEQNAWLADAYNTIGLKFLQLKSAWPAGKSTIADFSQNEYTTYVRKLSRNDAFPEDAISLSSWAKTSAPLRDWRNYIETYTTGDKYPYRPNGSAVTRYVFNTYVPGVDNRRSIGVDCSGFLQRCASYPGTRYLVGTMNHTFTWTGGVDHLAGVMGFMNNSDLIWEDAVTADRKYDPQTPIPANVVAGDILVFKSGDQVHDHVAMVFTVNRHPDGSPLTRSDVVLIEAAAGINPKQYYVMNTQTWWDYRNVDWAQSYTFYLRRLKLN